MSRSLLACACLALLARPSVAQDAPPLPSVEREGLVAATRLAERFEEALEEQEERGRAAMHAPDGPIDDRSPVEQALGLPPWLEFSGEHRSRYEWVEDEIRDRNTFRSDNHLWVLRTRLLVTARGERWRATTEIQDSRAIDSPEDGFISRGIVNPLDVLQLFVGHTTRDAFVDGDTIDLRLGRQTLDVGSRRFVARNRFRNTTNAFTGVYGGWKNDDGDEVQAFAFVPVIRRPGDRNDLRSNESKSDDEAEGTQFYGIHGKTNLDAHTTGELYTFVLDEDDSGDVETRDRELATFGARVNHKPRPGEFSFEWESAFQFGDSRTSSNPANAADLDHQAHFHRIGVGYQWAHPWKPHLEFVFDYASGDDDPNDGDNERFDTLFGARRGDIAPTGIWGPLARSNLVSPGLRLDLRPDEATRVQIAARQAWLASDRDAWTTTGLVDPTGNSGDEIGQVVELRVRHEVVPDNWLLDFGVAHLFAGDFIEDAPNNSGQDDSSYAYAGFTYRF